MIKVIFVNLLKNINNCKENKGGYKLFFIEEKISWFKIICYILFNKWIWVFVFKLMIIKDGMFVKFKRLKDLNKLFIFI